MLRCSESLLCLVVLSVFVCPSSEEDSTEDNSIQGMLLCLRREYTLKATRSDTLGRSCWDIIRATSCWGRCDSFEIPDWRFPYKISYHPVCMHNQKILRRVQLRHCDPGVDPELRIYEFYEAQSCSCRVCNSSDTFCDWKSHIPLGRHHQAATKIKKTDY